MTTPEIWDEKCKIFNGASSKTTSAEMHPMSGPFNQMCWQTVLVACREMHIE